MLPSDTPLPLEVRGSGVGPGGRESVEKGVRALVEWVGREQASAMDRGRRKDALMNVLKRAEKGPEGDPDAPMILDGEKPVHSPQQEKTLATGLTSALIAVDSNYTGLISQSSTMKEMERLMEELIGFQERFGPGAKNRERERRLAAA